MRTATAATTMDPSPKDPVFERLVQTTRKA
jgi:hypothetical protein